MDRNTTSTTLPPLDKSIQSQREVPTLFAIAQKVPLPKPEVVGIHSRPASEPSDSLPPIKCLQTQLFLDKLRQRDSTIHGVVFRALQLHTRGELSTASMATRVYHMTCQAGMPEVWRDFKVLLPPAWQQIDIEDIVEESSAHRRISSREAQSCSDAAASPVVAGDTSTGLPTPSNTPSCKLPGISANDHMPETGVRSGTILRQNLSPDSTLSHVGFHSSQPCTDVFQHINLDNIRKTLQARGDAAIDHSSATPTRPTRSRGPDPRTTADLVRLRFASAQSSRAASMMQYSPPRAIKSNTIPEKRKDSLSPSEPPTKRRKIRGDTTGRVAPVAVMSMPALVTQKETASRHSTRPSLTTKAHSAPRTVPDSQSQTNGSLRPGMKGPSQPPKRSKSSTTNVPQLDYSNPLAPTKGQRRATHPVGPLSKSSKSASTESTSSLAVVGHQLLAPASRVSKPKQKPKSTPGPRSKSLIVKIPTPSSTSAHDSQEGSAQRKKPVPRNGYRAGQLVGAGHMDLSGRERDRNEHI